MLLDLLFDHAHILQSGATVTPVPALAAPKKKKFNSKDSEVIGSSRTENEAFYTVKMMAALNK